ncbi:hypothetical protein QE197_10880 [Arsenophonus nasoniae]|uniref:Phage tail protein n=1 Tax=Arsenophonus nasoniae TaxID=638 RepID=A0A4P7KUT3_9GAMM|nr:hypothetical protein [Arsenophonus nasoniae]QBY43969.1 hypothetical protein ArsFIN_25420 [Arsenophonus nasoniae]WGM04287.1 hypothetical protein QE258_11610 [Arsenophonus nasoniae]WGM09389.1 hypothetical protein QE197_10880 [Arsenophonus nasoniae]WGM14114.1 hypothetical protein QE193_10775 [Arsenophonus nasoniae]
MRYYRLTILKDGKSIPVNVGGQNVTIGPFDTSKTPSYGLHIEFDILIQGWNTVTSGTVITIFGLPVEVLNQSINFEGCQVTLEGGFQAGLPLSNPKQNGVILQGKVYTAYANWLGTNQCLMLSVTPQQFDQVLGSFPIKPITITGKLNDKLSDVLNNALKNAYPDYKIEITISDELVLTEDIDGVYPGGLSQLAGQMRSYSRGLYQNAAYDGVRTTIQDSKIKLWDNAYIPQKIQTISIKFEELIGQPTWVEVNTISFKCPMRADIRVGDYIQLSKNPYTSQGRVFFGGSSQVYNYAREKINFSGYFQIRSVRHIGQYLNADANNAWVTIYEANIVGKPVEQKLRGYSIPLPKGVTRPG